jgi:hypothetical protein
MMTEDAEQFDAIMDTLAGPVTVLIFVDTESGWVTRTETEMSLEFAGISLDTEFFSTFVPSE